MQEVYWLLYYGNIQEVKFLDLAIKDIATLRWATVVIMAFIYYQGVSSLAVESYIMDIYMAFWGKHLPIVVKNNLIAFTFPPSFFNNERLFMSNEENRPASYIAGISGGTIGISLLFAPLALIFLFMFANVSTLSPADITIIKIITGFIALLLVIRTITIILFDILRYGEQ